MRTEDGVTDNGLYGIFTGDESGKWMVATFQRHLVITKTTPPEVIQELMQDAPSGLILLIAKDMDDTKRCFDLIKKQTGENTKTPPWIAEIFGK